DQITSTIDAGRRGSSYFLPNAAPKKKGGPGLFDEVEEKKTESGPVNRIRQLVKQWRDRGWPDVTPVTRAVNIPARLEATPTQFGGRRWWFLCPLIARGMACNRRAGKLYLPPGAKYFGCRKCHDLTYRSCQEAHQAERLFGRLGFDSEVARLLSKRAPKW